MLSPYPGKEGKRIYFDVVVFQENTHVLATPLSAAATTAPTCPSAPVDAAALPDFRHRPQPLAEHGTLRLSDALKWAAIEDSMAAASTFRTFNSRATNRGTKRTKGSRGDETLTARCDAAVCHQETYCRNRWSLRR